MCFGEKAEGKRGREGVRERRRGEGGKQREGSRGREGVREGRRGRKELPYI